MSSQMCKSTRLPRRRGHHYVSLLPIDMNLELTRRVPPADIISTVEFDHTGNYLATGDKGGRVVLFERNETVCYTSLLSVACCWHRMADVI